MPRSVRPRHIPCPEIGCGRLFTNKGGLTNHQRTHEAMARFRRQQQPATGNYSSDDGPAFPADDRDPPVFSDDMDGPDLPPTPNSPQQPPPDVSHGEEVRIHPLINGKGHDFFS
jgi:hypothetical protein